MNLPWDGRDLSDAHAVAGNSNCWLKIMRCQEMKGSHRGRVRRKFLGKGHLKFAFLHLPRTGVLFTEDRQPQVVDCQLQEIVFSSNLCKSASIVVTSDAWEAAAVATEMTSMTRESHTARTGFSDMGEARSMHIDLGSRG